MRHFRQSTNNSVLVGPFLSQSDGKTALTLGGITWANVTCTVYKGTTGADVSLTSGGNIDDTTTVAGEGYFNFTPGSTYFDTIGPLTIEFNDPTQHLHVKVDGFVIDETLYDWLYGTDLKIDTIETLLKAAMDGNAATPSGVGSFLPSTDSLEALRARFDTAITPNLVGGGSLSSSGFLADAVSMVRQIVSEPDINTKYTDGDIIAYLEGGIATVMADINANTDHPVVARVDIPIIVDQQVYHLPPQCQKIYYIAKINSTYGTKEWEILPGSRWNFYDYGFTVEGNTIRLLSKWKNAYTLQIAFVPSSESKIHKATAVPVGSLVGTTYRWTVSGSGTNEYYCELSGGGDPSLSDPGTLYIDGSSATEGTLGSLAAGEWGYGDNDSLGYSTIYVRLSGGGDPDSQAAHHIQTGDGTQVTLDTTPADGTYDGRPQAYAGYLFRVLSSTDTAHTYEQDRVITSFNNQTGVATFPEALSPMLQGTITYEVVPMFTEHLKQVWVIATALTLLAMEGAGKKYTLVENQYQKKIRALRMTLRKEFRLGQSFENRTPNNPNLGTNWGFGTLS